MRVHHGIYVEDEYEFIVATHHITHTSVDLFLGPRGRRSRGVICHAKHTDDAVDDQTDARGAFPSADNNPLRSIGRGRRAPPEETAKIDDRDDCASMVGDADDGRREVR